MTPTPPATPDAPVTTEGVFICPESHRHDQSMHCYNHHGCRCEPCAVNKVEYNYWYRHVKPTGRIADRLTDATGTRRRLQALMRAGWTATQLAAHMNGTRKQNIIIMAGKSQVEPATKARVAKMYDELWDRVPPGGKSSRTMRRAEVNGWAPALAWDDDTIDDPNAKPDITGGLRTENTGLLSRHDEGIIRDAIDGAKPRLSPSETREAIRVLNGRYWASKRIAAHIGCDRKTVERVRAELGLHVPHQTKIRDAA